MEFTTDILSVFDKKWALLTAGDEAGFNTMTISWGGLGTLWNKPVATVYVRTSRYTHDFMDTNDYFTVSFYPEECRPILGVLGSKSGREMDKMVIPCHLRRMRLRWYAERCLSSRWMLRICRRRLQRQCTRDRHLMICISEKSWTSSERTEGICLKGHS